MPEETETVVIEYKFSLNNGAEKQFTVRLPKDVSRTNLRVIAFVQESDNGRVLGSAVKILTDRIAIR